MPQVQKQEIKDSILESAKQEFYLQGYDKASMRAIAKAAGITAGNLYRYFENKDDLYDAVITIPRDTINGIISKYTMDIVNMDKEVNPEEVKRLFEDTEHKYIKLIIDEIVGLFLEDRVGLFILLRNEHVPNHSKMRYSFVDWVESTLKIQNESEHIAKFLAAACIEGLLKIAKTYEDEPSLVKALEDYVRFFFVRGRQIK